MSGHTYSALPDDYWTAWTTSTAPSFSDDPLKAIQRFLAMPESFSDYTPHTLVHHAEWEKAIRGEPFVDVYGAPWQLPASDPRVRKAP